jgi:hypothetical protein
MKTPQQVHQELHDQRTDAFTPYSLTDRMTAARLADMIPAGPTQAFLSEIAAGNDTSPAHKEFRP